jgi:hypothetical protein
LCNSKRRRPFLFDGSQGVIRPNAKLKCPLNRSTEIYSKLLQHFYKEVRPVLEIKKTVFKNSSKEARGTSTVLYFYLAFSETGFSKRLNFI